MNEENDQQEITSTDSNILTESGGSEMFLFRNPMDDEDLDIFDCFKSGEISEVENIVDKLGSEILSSRDKHGYTVAHWVALDGNVELLRFLIERNAPIDLPCLGIQGPHPIHWAARKGHTAIIQLLLQTGQVQVNTADFKGLTPLMTAAMYGRTISACYLLGMGALHHLTDINGDTALHWAAYKGHSEIIQILINSGVDLQVNFFRFVCWILGLLLLFWNFLLDKPFFFSFINTENRQFRLDAFTPKLLIGQLTVRADFVSEEKFGSAAEG